MPIFRSFVSAGRSSVSLLLVTMVNHPGSLFSEIAAAFDSGDAATKNPSEAMRNALDEIFGHWDSFKRVFVNKLDLKEGQSNDAPVEGSPFGRAWQAVFDAVESWFAPREASSPARQPAASQERVESGNAAENQSGTSTKEIVGNSNLEPGEALNRTVSAQTDAEVPQPSALRMLSPKARTHRMRQPPDENRQLQDGELPPKLDSFRPYLYMLARLQFDEMLQGKLDESDIVQQTLLEAHQSFGNFRGSSKPEKMAWLRSILARNIADEVRKFRSGKRDARLEASFQIALSESTSRVEQWLAHDSATPSVYAMANERVLALAAALIKLPDDQRRAVELHHLQGLPSAEVAKQLGRTEVAVAGLLRRGVKRLRELMCEDESR